MQSRNTAVRKSREPDRRPSGLLSVRSALVLGFALLAALGGAGLLYTAHRPVALVVLGAIGIFAAALKLLDSMIELSVILQRRWPGPGLTETRWFRLRLRSGDGPLSVRVRPSSLKRDCGRRTTSTGGKFLVNVHARSRLTLEPLRPLRSETMGQAEPARTGRGPSPAQCGRHRAHQPERGIYAG
jgi:hypothetical protein